MNRKHRLLSLSLTIAFLLLAGSVQVFALEPGSVEASSPPPDTSWDEGERPFQLPFSDPPGPDTWYLVQPYGNTIGAYFRRYSLYGASGGIHFGIDLAAPCRTEILAIADGVVFAVDGPFGSPPHNLTIDHPQLGYASMYGHLIEAPDLRPGQAVKQGEVIALVGDSAGLCYRRPHLHLEIRDLDHVGKYNPQTLIDADWDTLALVGSGGRGFMRDLAEPRKWQTLYDQPQARIGGPILNDFRSTWPLDWEESQQDTIRPLEPLPTSTPASASSAPALRSAPYGRQVTVGDCCTQPYWSSDSSSLLFLDRPQPNAATGVWQIDVTNQTQTSPQIAEDRLAIYSPDRRLIAYPDRANGLSVVERLADGRQWRFDTGENAINFTPDSKGVIWVIGGDNEVQTVRDETLWLADFDGSNARPIYTARGIGAIRWLAEDELLLFEELAGTSDERLLKLSLTDGNVTELFVGPGMRGVTLGPNSRHLAYYVRFEAEKEKNGVWILDLENPSLPPVKASFFGSYRWRDENRLLFVPLDPAITTHDFYEYNLTTGQTRSLFPNGTQLTIANNDWQVSPDGAKIALVAAQGRVLDGIWVLDID